MEIPSRLDGVPVGEIGKEAFSKKPSLKSVAIPDSVEVVGEKAFYDCKNLEELRLGRGIKKIEKEAFNSCISLKSVEIPGSVESVGEWAFKDCSELEELHLGAGIIKIEKSAFWRCRSLKSVEIPDSVESVSEYAFDNCCSLRRVVDHSNRSDDAFDFDTYYKLELQWPGL